MTGSRDRSSSAGSQTFTVTAATSISSSQVDQNRTSREALEVDLACPAIVSLQSKLVQSDISSYIHWEVREGEAPQTLAWK